MDFATLGGIIAGIYLIVFWGIGDPGRIAMFIDIPSVAITLGGSLSAILIAYPMSSLLSVFSAIKHAFVPTKYNPEATVKQFISLSEQARREGILSLENSLHLVKDEFFRRGLQLAVDGTDPGIMRGLMENELDQIESRHQQAQQVLDDMAALAPAFGMIGTLIGLVLMLANMSDPDSIGPAMAVALITTFYGALVANLFCIPMSIKLKGYSQAEIRQKNMILEGVMALQSGENPRLVEWKMLTYLSPDHRIKVRAAREKEAASDKG